VSDAGVRPVPAHPREHVPQQIRPRYRAVYVADHQPAANLTRRRNESCL
jgi:hypothetical protein